jgi:hypothetical protein
MPFKLNAAVAVGATQLAVWLSLYQRREGNAFRPGFPNRKLITGKETKGSCMMFLVLPSHSAQIFPFLKYPAAHEPQYGPACGMKWPPRRLAQGGRGK